MVEDWKRFLNKIEDLKPYLIGFNENNIIKDKTYPADCVVKDKDY